MDTANHAKRPEEKGNTESFIMRGSRPKGYAHIVAGIRPRRERLRASGARPRGANTPRSRHGEKSRERDKMTKFEHLQKCDFEEFTKRIQGMICGWCEQGCHDFQPECIATTKDDLESELDFDAERRAKEEAEAEARQKAEDEDLEKEAVKILCVWWKQQEG